MMADDNKELFGLPGSGSQDAAFTPLADRMRPVSLEQFEGQEHILGPGAVLCRMIETDRITSMVFWGPPGSGKTTLAGIIAGRTGAAFENFSAVSCGVRDIRDVAARARERLKLHRKRTILFLDEIHRFNKAQQDALLPHVEKGLLTLIGATTENPSFEVNSALLSRVKIFVLKRLEKEHLARIVERALADTERGLGELGLKLEPDAGALLLEATDGDARTALSTLELAGLYFMKEGDKGGIESPEPAVTTGTLTREIIVQALQKRLLLYDREGDQHYDVISAFIKSMRGSNPDAALYYMARMLEAGEDPLFILRRMIIFASEDVGNADPRALEVAVAAHRAVSVIGLPEGAIVMSQAVTYLATAPKSNSSYLALTEAQEAARKHMSAPVPLNLRNAPTKIMKSLGYGKGYKYAHDFPYHFADQQYMPDELEGARFYEPTTFGFEREITKRLEWWRKLRNQSRDEKKDKD
ncbi:MAG: replication-associated recombination protein A [Gemmatimonadota bacterium]|nr:replication-associated recombination protein A [Gemmatimonadota bacterium]